MAIPGYPDTSGRFKVMKLFLFTSELNLAKMAEQSGIDSVMIDWERKTAESGSADGPVDTAQDLVRLVSELDIPVSVRINGAKDSLEDEVNIACECGAEYIMLPMAKHEDDVYRFIDLVNGRAQTIVQIETQQLVNRLGKFRNLRWNHAYIGMLDLASSRGEDSIWPMLLDHTIESIVTTLRGRSIGFGGITVVGGGSPVPFTMLLHEMTRLGCTFSFMRRSFKREVKDRDFNADVDAIRSLIKASSAPGDSAINKDHSTFMEYISRLVLDNRRH